MRLKRLDVSGFGTFRSPASVNLSDVDYFAIVGPTGSGKTTLIDAIVFALYGSAPRWGERDILALAPSQSTGRVCLVFEVGGQRYAASRKVARGPNDSVTTKEARLERLNPDADLSGAVEDVLDQATETLAGSARDMREAVESLLGLNYTQFTQCMVLPQGEFDHFLHASSKERNEILVKLLGMQVYETVRAAAQQRRRASEARSADLRGQLERASGGTPEAELQAQQRVQRVQTLLGALPEAVNRLSEAQLNLEAEQQRLDHLDAQLRALTATLVPDGVDELAGRQRQATQAVEAAKEVLDAADLELGKARAHAEQAGEVAQWTNLVKTHQDRATLNVKLVAHRVEWESLNQQLRGLVAARDLRQTDLQNAELELRRAEAASSAALLAAQLTIGAPCPVCEHPVAAIHKHVAPADLQPANDLVAAAKEALDRAGGELNGHEKVLLALATRMEGLVEQIHQLDDELVDQPDLQETERCKSVADDARARHAAALGVHRTAQGALAGVEQDLGDLREELATARGKLAVTRDRLVAGGLDDAPVAGSIDLAQDWAALTSWAVRESDRCSSLRSELAEAVERSIARRELSRVDITKLFDDAAIPVPEQLQPAVLEMQARHEEEAARTGLTQIQEQLRAQKELSERLKAAEDDATACSDLELQLDNRHFVKWLGREALEVLVLDASETLRELSSGQYELTVNDKDDLAVVDYTEAGETRAVRTLSGGETFQASLALALALSQQIASMSALGATLETLLLDEGFGTLDPDALELVAGALARLATGQERTVGVITHVRELAEQVDVQFQVSRDEHGSHVRRVEQEST